MLAGADFAVSHLEVESADVRTRYDLSAWGCGLPELFAVAWTPDNRLTCVAAHDLPFRLCTGGVPFARCQAVPLSSSVEVDGRRFIARDLQG